MRFLVVAVLIASSGADIAKMDVRITSRDGVNLAGTYLNPGKPGPGIVLFHQCDGSDRGSWGGFPGDLAAAGFHVLTFDNRGTGHSGRGRETAANLAGDADAAYSWLAWQPGVDKSRIAAGGSSCGVGSASNLAASHTEIKALVLISGGIAGAAVPYIARTPGLAIFAVGSRNDPLTSNLTAVVQSSKNPRSTMKSYEGSTHGVSLFVKDRELRPSIVQWLQSVMK